MQLASHGSVVAKQGDSSNLFCTWTESTMIVRNAEEVPDAVILQSQH